MGGRNTASGASFVTGEIIQAEGDSATIQLVDGGSKVILLSDAIEISKMTEGSLADLAEGTSVIINGTTNTDGSMTASNIQIRPEGQDFPGIGGEGFRGGVPDEPQTQQ